MPTSLLAGGGCPLFLAILLAASLFLGGVLPGAVRRSLSVLAMAVEAWMSLTTNAAAVGYVPDRVAFVYLVVEKVQF